MKKLDSAPRVPFRVFIEYGVKFIGNEEKRIMITECYDIETDPIINVSDFMENKSIWWMYALFFIHGKSKSIC